MTSHIVVHAAELREFGRSLSHGMPTALAVQLSIASWNYSG